jgi:hypothetical protein
VDLVRLAWIPGQALLICVDGLASYPTAFGRAFREKIRTGRRGRPPLRWPNGVWLGQVIKKHAGRCLVEVVRRVLWGKQALIEQQLLQTKTGRPINTSYIERLNATFRARLAALTRRGRRLVHQDETRENGMYLVGGVYNFCSGHRSLRLRQESGRKWPGRTPAMAAGWTDHVGSFHDLLAFKPPVPLHG